MNSSPPLSSHDFFGTECSICYEMVDSESTHTLPCGHPFHDACIQAWFARRRSSCPLCRQPTAEGLLHALGGAEGVEEDDDDEVLLDTHQLRELRDLLMQHRDIVSYFEAQRSSERSRAPTLPPPPPPERPTFEVTEVVEEVDGSIQCVVNEVPFQTSAENVRLVMSQVEDVGRDEILGALWYTGDDVVETIMFLTE